MAAVPSGDGASGNSGMVRHLGPFTQAGAAGSGVHQLGFDTVDAGTLAQSWRIEPEATAYIGLPPLPPATPFEQVQQAPGRPVPAAELHRALEAAERVHMADRTY